MFHAMLNVLHRKQYFLKPEKDIMLHHAASVGSTHFILRYVKSNKIWVIIHIIKKTVHIQRTKLIAELS